MSGDEFSCHAHDTSNGGFVRLKVAVDLPDQILESTWRRLNRKEKKEKEGRNQKCRQHQGGVEVVAVSGVDGCLGFLDVREQALLRFPQLVRRAHVEVSHDGLDCVEELREASVRLCKNTG